MEKHEQLSLAIARSDLLYAGGSIISAGTHLRSWPFAQWGTMVAFEARKTMRDVHDVQVDLDWEDEIAESARHGGKFFDGRGTQFESVVADFQRLAEATHLAFYPSDWRRLFFKSLRRDFAVFTHKDEVVLTNVTGHYMVGLPPDRGLKIDGGVHT